MAKIDVQVTGSGFVHPQSMGLRLPIMTNEQLRASTKALNDSLKQMQQQPKAVQKRPVSSDIKK